MDVYCTHWLLLLEKWKFPFFFSPGTNLGRKDFLFFFPLSSPVRMKSGGLLLLLFLPLSLLFHDNGDRTPILHLLGARKEGKGMSERASEIWRRRQATMSKNFRFGFHWELSAGWKSSYYHFTTGTLEYLPFFVFRLESCRRGLLALLHLGYILSRPSIRYRHHTTICANAMCVFMALQLRQKLVALAIS